jgi:hypothetical protein
MLAAAHRREFDSLLVWAADRLARSVRHFLEGWVLGRKPIEIECFI